MEENPWVFQFDELDLLHRSFCIDVTRDPQDPLYAIAKRVYAKRDEAERAAEHQLDRELEHMHPGELGGADATANDLVWFPTSPVERSVFAQEAYRWAQTLLTDLRTAPECSETFEALLTVRVNAVLVPAKIAFSAEEEATNDAISVVIAEKEIDLAIIYLERVLDGLNQLAEHEVFAQSAAAQYVASGHRIMHVAVKKRAQLRSRLRHK